MYRACTLPMHFPPQQRILVWRRLFVACSTRPAPAASPNRSPTAAAQPSWALLRPRRRLSCRVSSPTPRRMAAELPLFSASTDGCEEVQFEKETDDVTTTTPTVTVVGQPERRRGQIEREDTRGGNALWVNSQQLPRVSRGKKALRHYLSWDFHIAVTSFTPEELAAWLEEETLAYMCHSNAALLRVRAESIRRLHSHRIDPLVLASELAGAALDASEDGARIKDATASVSHVRAAIAGMESFRSGASSGPEMRRKQNAVVPKLEAMRASLPRAESELSDATSSSELWCQCEWARAALAVARDETGLTMAESSACSASTTVGRALVTKGSNYERVCLATIRQMLENDALIDNWRPLDNDGGVVMLHNVTLGAHTGEIDCMVVRINNPDEAFIDCAPQDGDGINRRGQPSDEEAKKVKAALALAVGEKNTTAAAAVCDATDKTLLPAVEVLMVMEFKRNANDLPRSFHSKQAMLGWLSGLQYDPDDWRNKRHPSGHFARGYHHMKGRFMWVAGEGRCGEEIEEDWCGVQAKQREEERLEGGEVQVKSEKGEEISSPLGPATRRTKRLTRSQANERRERSLILTPESFHRYRRDETTGFLLDGCWLVTRQKPLSGLDAKVREKRPPPPLLCPFALSQHRFYWIGRTISLHPANRLTYMGCTSVEFLWDPPF